MEIEDRQEALRRRGESLREMSRAFLMMSTILPLNEEANKETYAAFGDSANLLSEAFKHHPNCATGKDNINSELLLKLRKAADALGEAGGESHRCADAFARQAKEAAQ
ncbi:hypothetical protein [Saccharibacter floricola]|uniref:Uncharacterized protein n=1 Tax=Saccharibacter floricola DSM 15669 TaxID=1123227 RepID=A0ABQ0P1Z1_9PROT|nr:hypothetical protein [Saccharibacter floricola]GBQ09073.1 hypothetical protein AA15669_2045 [Saccharibacter floricola DSM 15669]